MSTDEDDVLAQATRALRDAGPPPLDELRQTRRRIMEAAGRAERPARRWLWLSFQLAAFLLAATALAATTGRLAPMVDAVRGLFVSTAPRHTEEDVRPPATRRARTDHASGAVDVVSPGAPAVDTNTRDAADEARSVGSLAETLAAPAPRQVDTRAAISAPIEPGTVATGAADGPTTPVPARRAADSALPTVREDGATAAPDTMSAEGEPGATATEALDSSDGERGRAVAEVADDPDLSLYRAAHRAHFVTRDPQAALAAWDRYLAAHPRGTFALEARYNRALCLVRLGRSEAAERALVPFASGSVGGGYRRAEAEQLLEALRAR